MSKEELIENYLVYTDNGIEKVHWCNVNGVKELVSPKGKVYGYVPNYFENKRLQEQLNEANAIIEDMRPFIQASMSRQTFTRILNYEDKWGVK